MYVALSCLLTISYIKHSFTCTYPSSSKSLKVKPSNNVIRLRVVDWLHLMEILERSTIFTVVHMWSKMYG